MLRLALEIIAFFIVAAGCIMLGGALGYSRAEWVFLSDPAAFTWSSASHFPEHAQELRRKWAAHREVTIK